MDGTRTAPVAPDAWVDRRIRERVALLEPQQEARLFALRAAMQEYAAWESHETDRLLHRGCVAGPLLAAFAGAVTWVFAGLPVALGLTVLLWTSDLAVVGLLSARLSTKLERGGLERFDGLSTVPTDDETAITALLLVPEALAGLERHHHIFASLLKRGGVEPERIAAAVQAYRAFARGLRESRQAGA